MIKLLDNTKNNIIAIIIVEIITLSISFSADYSAVAGFASVILKWIPALVGVTTLLLYFVSRLFLKKYNWIISLIGIITMFYAAYNLYITN